MNSSIPPPPDSSPDGPAEPPATPAEIARAHGDFVRAISEKLGLDPADADDVLQSISEALLKHPERAPTCSKAKAWLRTVALRMALNELVRRSRRQARDVPFAVHQHSPPDTAPSAEDALIARQTRAILWEAVDRLPPEQREVFVRHELLEEPIPDIAADLGVPCGTCSTRLLLARDKLRAHFERLAVEDERKGRGRRFGLVPFWWLLQESFRRLPPEDIPHPDTNASRPPRTSWGRPALLFAAAVMLFVCASAGPPPAAPAHALAGPTLAVARTPDLRNPERSPDRERERAAPGPERSPDREHEPANAPAARVRVPTPRPPSPPPIPRRRPAEPDPEPDDIAIPRAWMKRAEWAAAAGQPGAANDALRAYDAHAPDDPLPSTRRSMTEAIHEAGRR